MLNVLTGRVDASAMSATTVELSIGSVGIFRLYEQTIGPLTPILADELREAEKEYPAAWIEDAIRIAVKNNVRRLKYILAVLERMRAEGRYEQEPRDDSEDYLSRYEGYLPFADNLPE